MSEQNTPAMSGRRVSRHGDALAVCQLEAGALAVLEPSEGYTAEGWVPAPPRERKVKGRRRTGRDAPATVCGQEMEAIRAAMTLMRHWGETPQPLSQPLLLMAPEPEICRAIRRRYWKLRGEEDENPWKLHKRGRLARLVESYWDAMPPMVVDDDFGVFAWKRGGGPWLR